MDKKPDLVGCRTHAGVALVGNSNGIAVLLDQLDPSVDSSLAKTIDDSALKADAQTYFGYVAEGKREENWEMDQLESDPAGESSIAERIIVLDDHFGACYCFALM